MPDFFQNMPGRGEEGVYANIWQDLDTTPAVWHITEVSLAVNLCVPLHTTKTITHTHTKGMHCACVSIQPVCARCRDASPLIKETVLLNWFKFFHTLHQPCDPTEYQNSWLGDVVSFPHPPPSSCDPRCYEL